MSICIEMRKNITFNGTGVEEDELLMPRRSLS